MANIKEAIEFAKQNPDSPFATELRKRIESGTMDTELAGAGLGKPNVTAIAEQKQNETYTGQLKNDLNTRVERTGEILNRPDSSTLEKGVQLFGQGAGLAANAIEKTVEQVPGVKQAIGAVGSGINWLATSELSPIKYLGDVIGSSKGLQEITRLYDTDQNFKDSVDAVANVARLGGDVQMAADAIGFAKNVTNKIVTAIPEIKPPTIPPGGSATVNAIKDKVTSVIVPDSATIMNRVARLKPTDANKFADLAGETHGEYLAKTGNFGTPDQIITKEATKFAESINSVDNELAKLPGLYKDGSIADALDELLTKARKESSTNVKSPYFDKVVELISKNSGDGLNMSEINEVKRLFEKNVKLGYKGVGAQINPSEVAKATTIDKTLRNWQVAKAKELGFKNIDALNKQTQLSKFIINKLGDQIVGQSGLNGVTLSDWVLLGGGDPTAVAGFLTKKFFSSKGVQSKIAEYLFKGEKQGQIKPDVTITPENVKRGISPQGLVELPAGRGNNNLKQDFTPLIPSVIKDEAPAIRSSNTTINKTGDAYVKDRKTGKVKIVPKK